MEAWEFDFNWLRIRHYVRESVGSKDLPDLKAILFLIGLQEYGNWVVQRDFSKEEKRDLMHIATCALLEADGYYEFTGRDQDGWPHYKSLRPFTLKGVNNQEHLLKEKIIDYFDQHQTAYKNVDINEKIINKWQ